MGTVAALAPGRRPVGRQPVVALPHAPENHWAIYSIARREFRPFDKNLGDFLQRKNTPLPGSAEAP